LTIGCFCYRSHLLLVAGGIGITPLHSILEEIEARTSAGNAVGQLQRVTLVWCVRQKSMVRWCW